MIGRLSFVQKVLGALYFNMRVTGYAEISRI